MHMLVPVYRYQESKLRMQRTLALAILPRGNIRSKRAANDVIVDETPMPKIRRRKVRIAWYLQW